MMVFSKKYIYLIGAMLSFSCSKQELSPVSAANEQPMLQVAQRYRGFNLSPFRTKPEFEELAEFGVNVVRLSFDAIPLVNKPAPFGFNEEAFSRLDSVINWCEELGIRVMIDPHTTPGTRHTTTIFPTDGFWGTSSWTYHLQKLWKRIAEQYKDRGDVIFGYDLLNEPAMPYNSPIQWNDVVRQMVAAIRATGDQHTIIIEPAGFMTEKGYYVDRVKGIAYLELPDDDNLMIRENFYEPFAFTHQGVSDAPTGVSYPGLINGVMWDKERIRKELLPILRFQQRYQVPIFIGEFSASRLAGTDGDAYLADLIELFEEYGWHWTYHAYRSWAGWDPEMPVGDHDYHPRSSETPRMQLLRSYFAQ